MGSMKSCATCHVDFPIFDFEARFFEKFQVPEPVECFDCRQRRLLAARNERKLYWNVCQLCQKKILSLYSPDKSLKIYCVQCYWSDRWDPLDYGRDFDFNRPFFDQFAELQRDVPVQGINIIGNTNINSDYTNDNYHLKNCYLVFDGEQGEDCYFGETFIKLKDCMDFLFLNRSELCYECTNCENCYNLKYSQFCGNCSDSWFLRDCRGCKNCFGCANLVSKQYYIFNQPHTKEQYEAFIQRFQSGSFAAIQEMQRKVHAFFQTQPVKAFRGYKNENVSGDFVFHSKDSFYCFDCNDLRDCVYCTNLVVGGRDLYHVNVWGDNLELAYNSSCIGANCLNIFCSFYVCKNASNIFYSMYCLSSTKDLFGCVGLRQKQFCILNKQYTKEEYEALAPRIIEYMKKIGEWGQFFPIYISFFGYNETIAMDYYPMTKEQAIASGYQWKDIDSSQYHPQIFQIPDDIRDVGDDIFNETLACVDCGKNYRIIQQELKFYKRFSLPIPRKCPDCRHKDRLNLRNPREIYKRLCAKCGKEIDTTYSSDNPAVVYCEECYTEALS